MNQRQADIADVCDILRDRGLNIPKDKEPRSGIVFMTKKGFYPIDETEEAHIRFWYAFRGMNVLSEETIVAEKKIALYCDAIPPVEFNINDFPFIVH